MNNHGETLRTLMMGMILALLLVMVLGKGNNSFPTAMAESATSVASTNGIIALLGGRAGETLFIVDTSNKLITTYELKNNELELSLLAGADYMKGNKRITEYLEEMKKKKKK